MKKFLLVLVAIMTAIAISPVVVLGQTGNFSIDFSNNGVTLMGSGTFDLSPTYLNTSPPGNQGYLLVSFTGTYSDASNTVPGANVTNPFTLVSGSGSCSPNCVFYVGSFQVDDLVFPNNNVGGTPNSGYFDNNGIIIDVGGGVGDVNVDTDIYGNESSGPSGQPYVFIYYGGGSYPYVTSDPTYQPEESSTPVAEYNSRSMLALCFLGLAGAFLVREGRTGLFMKR